MFSTSSWANNPCFDCFWDVLGEIQWPAVSSWSFENANDSRSSCQGAIAAEGTREQAPRPEPKKRHYPVVILAMPRIIDHERIMD